MKITKAVIPAAGLGTRVLPATKSMPKEMLPIVDKPAIQYIVEEAVASGITDILIITNRGKGVIEDHFDISVSLEEILKRAGKTEQLDSIKDIHKLANIHYIRQIETKGLGHAVSRARTFIGDEPFVVMYGDDVIIGDIPATKELIDAYGTFGKGVLGIKPVSEEAIKKYSSLKVENIHDNVFKCTDMIEKPQRREDIFSLYSILGRCVLPPDIFEILDHTEPGAGGEIQLTDAMAELARKDGMTAVEFTSKRYDMGNKLGILQANIEVGLKHKEVGEGLREYIKELAKTL
ncbi:UTP--glucose-1-phosphate uridylyltransferase [uncultured Ruminococcus sp.]|uniref:UTP--glucose-1-phosphate uridylyltransferase n=1 Tax=uncultured Ruminococcus sp. TaxID=165186 RepID=UPI00292CA684|nr:UTP--glucose-1-phosphate uridylyltransferase [uncultured Ruminococcus sp.]